MTNLFGVSTQKGRVPTSPRSQEVSADQPGNVFINLVVHHTFAEPCLIMLYDMSVNQYLSSDIKQLHFAQQQAWTGAVGMVLLKLSVPFLEYL